MPEVFVSYSRKDKDFVRRLHEALTAQNRDTWVDWEDIPPTADWWKEVCAGIEAANAFVFVISPDSVRSAICLNEIEHAVANNKRLVPILRREVTEESDRAAMHPAISSHNWLFFRETDDFDAAFQTLIVAMDTDLGHVRQHTRLLVRAREWDNNRRSPDFLLQGEELQKAEAWLSQAVGKQPEPLTLHGAYITASRAAAARRQRTLLAGVTAALVVALALAGLSLLLYREADVQRGIADQNAATAIAAQGEAQIQAANAQTQAAIAQTQAAIATAAQGEAQAQAANAQTQAAIAQTQAAIATAAQGEAEQQRNVAQIQATTVARERDRARSIGLAGQAQIELNGPRPERAVLLVLEALRSFPRTWQAEQALGLAIADQLDQQSLKGHRAAVYTAAFAPDGARVVTASADGTARIWDAASRELLLTLNGHEGSVNRAVWSPDGTRIATASADGTARIWDAASGELLLTLSGHSDSVVVVAWSPDGTQVATGSADSAVRLWDASTGRLRHTLTGHTDRVNGVSWSPDGSRLVSVGADRQARIWDAVSGAELFILAGHNRAVNRAAWSPDSTQVVTVSDDRTGRIWNAQTGAELYTLQGHIGFVTRVAWSPDGRRILTASADDSARLWNALSGQLQTVLFGHSDDVTGLAWSADSARVITTSADRTARVWDVASGAQLLLLTGHGSTIYSADWSPTGLQVATASEDGTARLAQVWTNADDLVRLAQGCCISRALTDEERQQFGLPIPPGAPPPDTLVSCPGTLESRLYPGARGEVDDQDETALRVRFGPGLTRQIIAQILPRQTFRVIEGPQCVDNMAWFRILYGINAVDGWVSEGSGGVYFVRPLR